MKRVLVSVPFLLLAACTKPPQESAASAPPTAAESAIPVDNAALSAQHWRLAEATDAQGKRIDALFPRPEEPLTLDLHDGRANVGNSCNRMSGNYEIRGDKLAVGKLASTMMACVDPALAALDQAVSQRLEGLLTADLQSAPDKLTLTTTAGDILVFDGFATAETRYGGPGETVFLEVAAETKPCSHPLIPDKQCLQVREVSYDDSGLKTGTPGDFRNFFDGIEGYAHEPGVRNVLRTKRFRIANPPADASGVVHVLDLVVESEAVAHGKTSE